MESITKFAKNNKNTSSSTKPVSSENKSKKLVPDPFARPVKNIPSEEIKSNKEEIKEEKWEIPSETPNHIKYQEVKEEEQQIWVCLTRHKE